MIGDCQSAALISKEGSIDWLCWPRFDSPAVFAAILDAGRGGSWKLSPDEPFTTSRRYLIDTNVLETTFAGEFGSVSLTDFMPVAEKAYTSVRLVPDHSVIRILRCKTGRLRIKGTFCPRPDFGSKEVEIADRGKLGLRISSGHGMFALHANCLFLVKDGMAHADFLMQEGEVICSILTYSEASPEVIPLLGECEKSLARTIDWWTNWVSSNRYRGPYEEAVLRSVLTLKILEFAASGAFVAAPTTSLPERIGGELNWDYRYCWLRDSSFIIEALCGTGFLAEAESFAEWMLHATRRTQPKLMVMYGVFGNKGRKERVLHHLSGHRQSSPVNVGNEARDQSQLDTYGEVINGAAIFLRFKMEPADKETSKVLVGLGKYVCDHWLEPDAGIWETRDKPTVHTHSQLSCWVALDCLLKLDRLNLVSGVPVERFARTCESIRLRIETESWEASAGTYTNEPGRVKLDATLLRISIQGFEAATSARMKSTYAAVCRQLGAGRSLLYRNLPDDRIPIEGAFGICGFWRVEYLAHGGGSLAQAEQAFQELLSFSNDIGLFGEETDPTSGEVLGNFPQAFTHVGLINAAIAIEERRKAELSL